MALSTDDMRQLLGLDSSVGDDEVVQAYAEYLANQGNPAYEPPVTLDEARRHLRIVGTQDDADILSMLPAARKMVEGLSDTILTPRSITESFDSLCTSLVLTPWPIISVDEIVYCAPDGADATLDPSLVRQRINVRPGRLSPTVGMSWPTALRERAAVTVNMTAGFADPTDVPDDLVHAIKLVLGHLWENREAVLAGQAVQVAELPLAVAQLVSEYRFFTV